MSCPKGAVFVDQTTWWATDISLPADSPWSTLRKVTYNWLLDRNPWPSPQHATVGGGGLLFNRKKPLAEPGSYRGGCWWPAGLIAAKSTLGCTGWISCLLMDAGAFLTDIALCLNATQLVCGLKASWTDLQGAAVPLPGSLEKSSWKALR